ncbi:MAG: hypothetical protein PHX87_00910 [Candidatus Peribacteraceae bacterium]|nr:hypothetical protein [Candidatus Peribacteraceae bacterium]MDD5741969.1 hypothetical protein [Candidatus Peribacteraceae bacterium]
MPLFEETISAVTPLQPGAPLAHLFEDLVDGQAAERGCSQSTVRAALLRDMRQKGIALRLTVTDSNQIVRCAAMAPDHPPSPFDEHFGQEEVIGEKYTGPIGNPYEAKPTSAPPVMRKPDAAPAPNTVSSAVVQPHCPPLP